MSLTKQMDRPLLGFSRGLPGQATTAQQRELRAESGVLVRQGNAARFSQGQVALAAPATKYVREGERGTILWLVMPGAGRGNTEVLWEADTQQLHVGVWSESVPQGRQARPARLLWYSQHRCPGADGARVTAQLAKSWVMVTVPRLGAEAASLTSADLRPAAS